MESWLPWLTDSERLFTDLLHPERVRDGPLDLRCGPGDALATAQGFAGIRGELGLDATTLDALRADGVIA